MTDVVSLLGRGASREAPFRNSFSSTSLPTRRSSAAMRASCVCTMSAAPTSLVEGAGLVLGDPDADQVARDLVALGEPVQGLAGEILLRHLALELDWIAAVLAHGLSPRKPGPDSPILKPPHLSTRRGALQIGGQSCMPIHRCCHSSFIGAAPSRCSRSRTGWPMAAPWFMAGASGTPPSAKRLVRHDGSMSSPSAARINGPKLEGRARSTCCVGSDRAGCG